MINLKKENNFLSNLTAGVIGGLIVWIFGILVNTFKLRGFIESAFVPALISTIIFTVVIIIYIWIFEKRKSAPSSF